MTVTTSNKNYHMPADCSSCVLLYILQSHTVTNPNNGLQATDTLFISSVLPTSAALYQQLKDAETNIQQQKNIQFLVYLNQSL